MKKPSLTKKLIAQLLENPGLSNTDLQKLNSEYKMKSIHHFAAQARNAADELLTMKKEVDQRGHVIDSLSAKVERLTGEKIAAGIAYEKLATCLSQSAVECEEQIESLELKLAVKNLLLICSCGLSLFFLTLAIATVILR